MHLDINVYKRNDTKDEEIRDLEKPVYRSLQRLIDLNLVKNIKHGVYAINE
jgi:hypothetical protein